MKDILRAIPKRIKCENYGCRNMAEYQIGERRHPQMNICKDCLKDLRDQIDILLEPAIVTVIIPEETKAPEKVEDTAPENDGDTTTDVATEGSEKLSDDENPEDGTDGQEYYVCKYCGEKFSKATEKMKYVNHVRTCPKKQEKENE